MRWASSSVLWSCSSAGRSLSRLEVSVVVMAFPLSEQTKWGRTPGFLPHILPRAVPELNPDGVSGDLIVDHMAGVGNGVATLPTPGRRRADPRLRQNYREGAFDPLDELLRRERIFIGDARKRRSPAGPGAAHRRAPRRRAFSCPRPPRGSRALPIRRTRSRPAERRETFPRGC